MAHYAEEPSHILPTLDLLRGGDKPLVVAVVGPPLSGKTWLAKELSGLLGHTSLQEGSKPAFLSLDEFVGPLARIFYEKTGLGLFHPSSYDVEELRRFVGELLSRGHARRIVRELGGSGLVEKERVYILPRGGVLIIEGLYACSLLEDLVDACIYVEVPRRLELIVRRVVKVAYHVSTEEGLRSSALSEIAWELYGKKQRKVADIVYLNRYRVLEDVGRPSYQFKVCLDDLPRDISERVRQVEPVPVEDYVVTEGNDRLRVRILYDGDVPASMEVSYRYPVPKEVPYLRTVKYSLDSQLLPAVLTAVKVSGLGMKVVKREIGFSEEEGVTFKYYPDRAVVELESTDFRALEPFVSALRGKIKLKSYYTGGEVCR